MWDPSTRSPLASRPEMEERLSTHRRPEQGEARRGVTEENRSTVALSAGITGFSSLRRSLVRMNAVPLDHHFQYRDPACEGPLGTQLDSMGHRGKRWCRAHFACPNGGLASEMHGFCPQPQPVCVSHYDCHECCVLGGWTCNRMAP